MIDAGEITKVTPIGTVDGDEVKLVHTKGGFHLAMRQFKDGSFKPIAAGSHPAIVEFQIEKSLEGSNSHFIPVMMKSEKYKDTKIIDCSKTLGDLSNQGFSLTAIRKNGELDITVSARGIEVGLFKCEEGVSTFTMNSYKLDPLLKSLSKEIVLAVSKSVLEICNKNHIDQIDTRTLRKV